MPRPSLVIFDCDGVLVDTEPAAAAVLRSALVDLGLPCSLEEVDERYRGRSLRDCVRLIEESLGRPVPEDFLPRLNAATFARFDEGIDAIPGVRAVLEGLRAAGVPLCVASSGSLEKMRKTLGLAKLLDLVEPHLFSASMVVHGKPAPDLFLFAAERLGVPPEACAVVEDSLPGITGALAAGMSAFAYAPGPSAELSATDATVFRSMGDLLGLLGFDASHEKPRLG